MNQPLIIEVVVGYLLKVMRAKEMKKERVNEEHKEEFKAIRHGRYDDFMGLIGADKPFMVFSNECVIKTKDISQEEDGDFAGLLLAGPALLNFYSVCFKAYGTVVDEQVPDLVYYHIVMFEIGLRMHASKIKPLDKKAELEEVINVLTEYYKYTDLEKEKIDSGRKFTNRVKHGKKITPHHFEGFRQACIFVQERGLVVGLGRSFSKKIA